MWKLVFGILLTTTLFFSSCGEKRKTQNTKRTFQVSLIHPLFFQEELSSNLNFPFWFNDSIISANKIMQITLTSMKGVPSDSLSPDSEIAFPKKTVVYTFNRIGQVIHIQITNYSEGIIIANQNYQINAPNTFNYSKILLKDNAYGVEKNVILYLPYKQTNDYLAYASDDDESMLHFILNPKYQKPLSVDSIAHPLPNDWVILGTPNQPKKRYHVYNKVKEAQVSIYTYYSDNFPSIVTNQEYPFFRKRFYNYSNNGTFIGFTDSTFIDETFVTAVQTSISYNKNLPTKIIHNKAHKDGVRSFETYESIDYTFYDK